MSRNEGDNNDDQYFEEENLAFLPADHVTYQPSPTYLTYTPIWNHIAIARKSSKGPSKNSRRRTWKG